MSEPRTTTGNGLRTSWKPEFDDALRADWPNGVSLREFARRFGYAGKGGAQIVRNHAIRLGLLKPTSVGISLTALYPELKGKRLKKFKPCATYNEYLDWLIWLDEDVGYVAHPVHPGLDVLRHPKDGHVVGFKILGAKALYKKAGVQP